MAAEAGLDDQLLAVVGLVEFEEKDALGAVSMQLGGRGLEGGYRGKIIDVGNSQGDQCLG